MRRYGGLTLALALAALPAWAQEDEGFGGDQVPTDDLGFEDEGEFEDEGAFEGEAAFEDQSGFEGAPEPQLGETHAVQSGDTLWDLSTEYLNNPWYWPKVWSYNPQLTNPHWIFPGNQVRFYPSDENLPTAVDVASSELDIPDEDLTIPGSLDEEDLVKTIGQIETARGTPDSIWTAFIGFVDQGSSRFTGQIVAAENETEQLDLYARLYVELETSAEVGQPLALYRKRQDIRHPATGELVGNVVELIGHAEVERLTSTVTVVRVTRAYRVIERGDYVGELPAYWGERVREAPNETEVSGYVVETVGDVVALVGEHHFVYLDRGRADGVQIGNTMRVLARGDQVTGRTDGLPYEQIGTLLVVDVQETGSTAVVTDSLRGITVGDRVLMTVN